jgi:glutathione S-transferase
MTDPVLLQIPERMWGLPSASPFCVKAETWLRMAGVPYKPVSTNPLRSPRGKLPWAIIDGEAVSDSDAIIRRLERRHGDPLNEAGLTPAQRHLGQLVQRTLEEGTYFLSLHQRWGVDANFAIVRRTFFGRLPFPIEPLVATMIKRQVRAAAWAQGVARYTDHERAAKARADADAFAWALGDQPYFQGDAPHALDASLYGFLCQIDAPFDGPFQAAVRSHPNLVDYVSRVRARYWAETPPLER